MRKRLQAVAIVAIVIAAGFVATRADANHGARTLQVHPELSSTPATPGTGQVLTAELSAAADGTSGSIQIDFEIEGGPADSDGISPESPDATCTVLSGATTCDTAPLPGVSTGQSTVRAWIDHDKIDETSGGVTEADRTEGRLSQPVSPPVIGSSPDCEPEDGNKTACETGTAASGATAEPDATDVVLITYTTGPTRLDCDDTTGDDTQLNNPADAERYTCTVRDQFGALLSGVRIDGENMDGPNDPDNSAAAGTIDYYSPPGSFCTTDGTGKCSNTISVTELQTGTGDICFWVDEPATTDNTTFNPVPAPPTGVNDGSDCDTETPGELEDTDVTDKVSLGYSASTPTTTTTTTTTSTTTTTVPTTTTSTTTTTTTTTSTTTTSTTTTSTTTTTTVPTTTSSTTTTTTAPTTTTTTTPPAPGTPLTQFSAYGGYTGGLDLAVGNLDDDPQDEIVTGAGPGGGPHVRVFDVASDGTVTPKTVQFMAYAQSFRGGVSVAIGDVNGDGKGDIITGALAGGGPHVRVFNRDGTLQNSGWFAYDQNFGGGVDVAVGNIDGDVVAEVITGAGPGGGPHVRGFNADPGGIGATLVGLEFFAYSPAFGGGVKVAVGNLDGDQSAAEIVTGAGSGGAPHVRVFTGAGAPRPNPAGSGWMAYPEGFGGGVNVAIANVLGAPGSAAEVITGAGPGGGPHVAIWSPSGAALTGYMAFSVDFPGGVVVGGGDVVTVSPPTGTEVSGGEVIAGTYRLSDVVAGRRFNF